MREEETYSYLKMASKALKWALRSGIAIGAVGHFGLEVDRILDIMLASSAAIGLLTALTNYCKFKLNWHWIP